MKTHKVEVTYEFITDLVAFIVIALLISSFICYGVFHYIRTNYDNSQILYNQTVELIKEQNVQIKKLENLAVCPKVECPKIDELSKLDKLDELKCKRCVTF